MDRKAIEDVVFKGFGGGGDDAIIRAGFPGFGEEFVKGGDFYGRVGGENSDVLAGGAEDFVDKVGSGGFAGGASEADEFHVAEGVTIIRGKKLGVKTSGFCLKGRLFRRFVLGGACFVHMRIV